MGEKAVLFTPPPPQRMGPIMTALQNTVKSLPDGTRGALIVVANEQGANAAIVHTTWDGSFTVASWIGKKWDGPLEYGTMVQKTW